ncbi:pyridoxamine 5'-phosphate oxidase [Burkholderia sp. Leaf177]|uniref:pyridoxamine 5'-phosphate oxidase family protein n=1 Tax=Burkholderia sp. Leaf177 TaxID=1736287 RepID=UPI0006FC3A3F|nr:pyridoxamine 5'-phosphate oxidase family protein [Burkholderia sp. Leaf177]KQR81634.1 pyridoxamine 5'-phosphate oxidase [Burkholderia sp. Leaf177]
MTTMTLADIAKTMAKIDFAMMSTRSADGEIASRPMSNNGDVEYDGDSYFFTSEDSHTVADIQRDAVVGLTFTGQKHLLGKPGLFLAIEGRAELIREKPAIKAHWSKEIDRWFEEGFNTPGVVLIRVTAKRLHYWDGEEDGEVAL